VIIPKSEKKCTLCGGRIADPNVRMRQSVDQCFFPITVRVRDVDGVLSSVSPGTGHVASECTGEGDDAEDSMAIQKLGASETLLRRRDNIYTTGFAYNPGSLHAVDSFLASV
jgi:hypothetical protein